MVKSIHLSETITGEMFKPYKKPRVIIELFNEVAMKYLYDSKKIVKKKSKKTRFLEKLAGIWESEKFEDEYLHSPHFAAGQVHFRTLPHTILAHSYLNRSYLLFVNFFLSRFGEDHILKHINVSNFVSFFSFFFFIKLNILTARHVNIWRFVFAFTRIEETDCIGIISECGARFRLWVRCIVHATTDPSGNRV
jgi:hypothetical protein